MIPLASSATIRAATLKTTALKTAALKSAVALTVAATGATLFAGTAEAATPAAAAVSASPAVVQNAAVVQNISGYPSFDPRRRGFRAHFRTYGECVFFANHDRNPRTNGWDCRHGGNRAFPWEYWY